MRYAQLVIGPAGCGKSTYCNTIADHGRQTNRIINVINLDPAAEQFEYEALADIRELIHIDDVMEDEDLRYGPNGGLVFCMEYLMENPDWLIEQMGDFDDDYILFDCPGQIELYTHLDIIRKLVTLLQSCDFRICTVFLLDSQFMIESTKFISGVMAALAAMVNLECPHINILSKMDLLSKDAQKQLGKFVDPDTSILMEHVQAETWNVNHHKLSQAFSKLIDDYSLVSFTPFNIKDKENISDVLMTIDNAIQYGEDQDVKVKDFDEVEDDKAPQ